MKKKMEMEAKKDMLHKLKSDMRGEMHKGIPEAFKGKTKKVIVEADSEEGLEKGLTMAQKIMKGKLGDILEHSEESSESEEESCGECGKEDCYKCGGVEKDHYEEGGTEEESEEVKNTTGQVNKFMNAIQGKKPVAPVKEDKLKKYYF